MQPIHDALWYKDAIVYQVNVRSFYDSNGDGIGDFRGLIQKLDYIQNLGVNTIWLLPFYPSPLKDGGYDIADFTGIHPSYGSLADFRRFVREAHSRKLRIITELVLNHTSSAHKWFQRARKAKPGSVYRDYYVWSDTPDKYSDARIIFQDFEVSNWSYDHEARAYYWHRFYSHQPDLNFENPRVQQEIFKVLDFWFDMGVDGFRLDAVPYLFEKEGTNCENLPETHAYLKKLRRYVDEHYDDKLLLAEANQWPDDAADYFGDGDECHMAFHFPLMPRLYMALQMEDRFPVVDILEQTPEIPGNCQWAIFLRNHDELTLEMVSDEERDYMYRAFALDPAKRVNVGIRRRLFPLLGGNARSIELLNVLLLSMPGTPIIYYGDEIGMGDNFYLGDRDGMRTPMQWSPDKNAGFSSADPQRLFLPVVIDAHYHYTSVNVENQEKNPSSFLWWHRRVVAKRRQYQAFGRGSIHFVNANNPKVLAFIRAYGEEAVLVVVNLSRYSQYVELDLSAYAGFIPVEVFSRNRFPVISDEPWPFSMQFKNYFWFELKNPGREDALELENDTRKLLVGEKEWNTMDQSLQGLVKERIFNYLIDIQWFRGDTRKLRQVNIIDAIPVVRKKLTPFLFIVQLDLIESRNDIYLMPLSLAMNTKADEIRSRHPRSVVATVDMDGEQGILYDGAVDKSLQEYLLELVSRRVKVRGNEGLIEGKSGRLLQRLLQEKAPLIPHMIESRHTNSSIVYGEKYFLKMYRSPQEGENTDVEIMKALTRETGFKHIPSYLGRINYRHPRLEDFSIAMLMELIPNVGSVWKMTETAIESFFDNVLSEKAELSRFPHHMDGRISEFIGPYFLEMTALLARRTAQLHVALSSVKDSPGFVPEPFSLLYQKSVYQSLRTFVKRNVDSIRKHTAQAGETQRELIAEVLSEEENLLKQIRSILETEKIRAMKIRIHGNYKLDKVLFTGRDFKIVNFEGELEKPLSARRIKHSPLKDVASMIGSFHYIVHKGFLARSEYLPVDTLLLGPVMEQWCHEVTGVFVKNYMEEIGPYDLIPPSKEQVKELLQVYLLEKSIREFHYFLKNDPRLLVSPLKILGCIRQSV